MNTAELIQALRNDPPQSHPKAPTGVWAAEESCLMFLAETVHPGWTTLETGCGASTAVFAHSGSAHTSVSLSAAEGEAVREWCARHSVGTDRLNLVAGSSTVELPKMDPTPLDLVFIDGCHAYPFPTVDWYYSAPRLRDGGVLVVDDLQLPAPHALAEFLRADPRWVTVRDGDRWGAWMRVRSGSLDEEWTSQPFFDPTRYQGATAAMQPTTTGRLRWLVRNPRRIPSVLRRRLHRS